MRRPGALRAGDRVAIVAPASPFPRDAFERGVAELASLGFEPVWDDRVFAREGYLAGGAQVRAEAFIAAWRDPSVRALVAARGGYGSVQILASLPPAELRAFPKVFVGASDLTAVLAYLTHACGLVAVHGPMVAGQLARGAEGYDRSSFLAAVSGPGPAGELGAGVLEAFEPGDAAGPLVGGNLTQLAASLGTPFAFDPPPGCVLFLEDVSERPYRVDRLLTQLRLAGILARARALVFGEMRHCDEADGSLRCRDVVRGLVRGFPGPVLYGLPAGHTAGPALSLPLGVLARAVAGPRPVLIIDEPSVA
jgi:muramoyltetrapeptide carboxypeptidase